MTTATSFLFAIPLIYAIIVIYFIFELLKKRRAFPHDPGTGEFPGISIVIPFRNEAHNLLNLIASLDSQTYPGDFEIVLVNDGSTDHFNEVIALRSPLRDRPLPQLRVVDSRYSPDRPLTSKQQALDYGIKEANNAWIALTDADMVLGPAWLETLMQPTSGGARFVFGHTAILADRKKTFPTWFQSFQLETLFSFANVFHRAGITGSCMGNNMLISKEAYVYIGGFESIGYSIVEDRDLLAAFRGKKIPTAATDPFFPTAFTLPCEKIKPYLHQLLRWTNGGFKINSILAVFGMLLFAHTALFLIALTGILPFYQSVMLLLNQFVTWLFIFISFKKTRSTCSPALFPLFFALFLIEAAFVCFTLLTKKQVLWKERKL